MRSIQHREDLIRVPLVEVEERRLALGGRRVPRADDVAANGRDLADVNFLRAAVSRGNLS